MQVTWSTRALFLNTGCVAPEIKSKILKSFQDPLSRVVTEGVLIESEAIMNSRSKFRNNKTVRIVIKDPRKSSNNDDNHNDEVVENVILDKIDQLRKERGLAPMNSATKRMDENCTSMKGGQWQIRGEIRRPTREILVSFCRELLVQKKFSCDLKEFRLFSVSARCKQEIFF